MFVDEAVIICSAGHGGKGCHSFDRSHPQHWKANGGDGGDGGAIIIEAQPNKQTLLDFQMTRNYQAQNGGNGSSSKMRGYRGDELVLGVPVGTEVIDKNTGEFLKDLNVLGARVTVCKGGAAGRGNSKNLDGTEGAPGEEKEILLKLKLIADIGIVGFPNAGKSTFISRVSNAKSKAAAYAFTTKNPILGVVKFDEGETKVLADIPGIIEGAHEGKGLGLEFLKHVERTRVLVHIIDFAAVDGRDPISDYAALNKELAGYSQKLAEKPQVLVANKIDVTEARENLKKFKKKVKKPIYPISAITGEGLDELLQAMRTLSSQ